MPKKGRTKDQTALLETVSWELLCRLPDARDPRIEETQWPCYGKHTEEKTFLANSWAVWKKCTKCDLRLLYCPRQGAPANSVARGPIPAMVVAALAELEGSGLDPSPATIRAEIEKQQAKSRQSAAKAQAKAKPKPRAAPAPSSAASTSSRAATSRASTPPARPTQAPTTSPPTSLASSVIMVGTPRTRADVAMPDSPPESPEAWPLPQRHDLVQLRWRVLVSAMLREISVRAALLS